MRAIRIKHLGVYAAKIRMASASHAVSQPLMRRTTFIYAPYYFKHIRGLPLSAPT
jgi:hypothetical protein